MAQLAPSKGVNSWALKVLQDFYAYSMGREMMAPPVLDFEPYDMDLAEMELIAKDEETEEVTFPKLAYLYEEAEKLLAPLRSHAHEVSRP